MKSTPVKWLVRVSSLAVFLITIVGCSKDGGVCLSNSGPLTTQERNLGDFDSIAVYNYVNIILKHDTVNKVLVECGRNIISGITTTVTNRQLVINNANACNWLRSYDKPINVYISARDLWKIDYESSGNITSENTLRYDSLKVDVWAGCGTIDLDLDIFAGFFALNTGTADFRLHGRCAINSVYTGEYGKFDGRALVTAYSFITNHGSNDAWVNATEHLSGNIGNIGNIYYTGNPKTIEESATGGGTGKLIAY